MFKKIIIGIVLVLVLIQFIPLEKTNPKLDKAIALHTDENIMKILKKSCYDCHSNETKWSIYSQIAPLSFKIQSNVKRGRDALNFSSWKDIKVDIKIARLKRAIKTVNNEMMPLSAYLSLHDEAKISKDEKKILVKWFEKELELIAPNEVYF
ncbi:MAG: heme-binding domain-containing protein [Campylobacterota bacterium]|nr:heme-binding domain-containing protein [Campylobacterota bacterium]